MVVVLYSKMYTNVDWSREPFVDNHDYLYNLDLDQDVFHLKNYWFIVQARPCKLFLYPQIT